MQQQLGQREEPGQAREREQQGRREGHAGEAALQQAHQQQGVHHPPWPLLRERLMQHAVRCLAPAARPAHYVLLRQLPRTPAGKVARGELPGLQQLAGTPAGDGPGGELPALQQLAQGAAAAGAAGGKPTTEAAVMRAFVGALGGEGQGSWPPLEPTSNFFDQGGDSLAAAEAAAALGVDARLVLAYPTARSLAAHLSALHAPGGALQDQDQQAGPGPGPGPASNKRQRLQAAAAQLPPAPEAAAAGRAGAVEQLLRSCARVAVCTAASGVSHAVRGPESWQGAAEGSAAPPHSSPHPPRARQLLPPPSAWLLEPHCRLPLGRCVDAAPVVLAAHADGSAPPRLLALACSHSGEVACLDVAAAACCWRVQLPGRTDAGMVAMSDMRRVVVACGDALLLSLRLSDGQLLGSCECGGGVRAAPVEGAATGAGSAAAAVVGYAGPTGGNAAGVVAWPAGAAADAVGDAAGQPLVWVATHGKQLLGICPPCSILYCQHLPAACSTRVAVVPLTAAPAAGPAPAPRSAWAAPPAGGAAGLVVASLLDGSTIAFQLPTRMQQAQQQQQCVQGPPGSLTQVWGHAGPAPVFSSPAVVVHDTPLAGAAPSSQQQAVVVGHVNGAIAALDAASGQQVWCQHLQPAGGQLFADLCCSPAAAPGCLLAATAAGRLHALRWRDGAQLWVVDLGGGPISAAPCWMLPPGPEAAGVRCGGPPLIVVVAAGGLLSVLAWQGCTGGSAAAQQADPSASSAQSPTPTASSAPSVVARVQMPGEAFSSPVGVGGWLLLGCRDDALHCLRLRRAQPPA